MPSLTASMDYRMRARSPPTWSGLSTPPLGQPCATAGLAGVAAASAAAARRDSETSNDELDVLSVHRVVDLRQRIRLLSQPRETFLKVDSEVYRGLDCKSLSTPQTLNSKPYTLNLRH